MEIRLGLIGAGGIVQDYHVKAFSRIPGVRIASVFDVNIEQASKVANMTGANIADSAEQLLDKRHIDAVLISSPQFARGQLEEVAASRNIHLLVEKPLGLNLEEVTRKGQAIRESGVINTAGYCLRYYDTVQLARQYLLDKQVHLVQIQRFGNAHWAKWWNTLSLSGGFLVDAVTHQVDLVRYLVGEYEEVYANFGRNSIRESNPEATIYDGGALTFRMRNGAVGTLTESCVSPHYNSSEVKIFGPNYYLSLSANGKQLIIVDEKQNISRSSDIDPYYEQNKRFAEAVATGHSQLLCSYEDAARTLAFTLAANQSYLEQRSIRIEA